MPTTPPCTPQRTDQDLNNNGNVVSGVPGAPLRPNRTLVWPYNAADANAADPATATAAAGAGGHPVCARELNFE